MTKCPICGGKATEHRETYTLEYKGNTFSYHGYIFYSCDSCGEDFEPENRAMDDAFIDFQRKVDDLLLPSDIRRIRAKLGLTQTDFAKVLGVGEKSFARYENGIVAQGRSMDNLLRVFDEMPSALQIIQRQKVKTVRPSNAAKVISGAAVGVFAMFATHFLVNLLISSKGHAVDNRIDRVDKQTDTNVSVSVPLSHNVDSTIFEYDLKDTCLHHVQ